MIQCTMCLQSCKQTIYDLLSRYMVIHTIIHIFSFIYCGAAVTYIAYRDDDKYNLTNSTKAEDSDQPLGHRHFLTQSDYPQYSLRS